MSAPWQMALVHDDVDVDAPTLKRQLHAAIATIAAVCDGARSDDGRGFDGTDAAIGQMMALSPPETWTDDMGSRAGAMCRKYQGQLGGTIGRSLAEAAEQMWPDGGRATTRDIRFVDANSVGYVVRFGYDPDVVAGMRGVRGARWSSAEKAWRVPLASKQALKMFTDHYGFTWSDAALAAVEDAAVQDAKPSGTVALDRGDLMLRFDYDREAVAAVRQLATRRWDGLAKAWRVPEYLVRPVKQLAERFGWELADEVAALDDRDPTLVPVEVEAIGGQIKVRFPYNEALRDGLKHGLGARWSVADKAWVLPAEAAEDLIGVLERADVAAGPGAAELLAQMQRLRERVDASRAHDADIEVAGLGLALRPFQKAGVAYIAESQFEHRGVTARGCVLGDEMGLGKTPQFYATVQYLDAFPALCITPAGLVKENWALEGVKWLPGRRIVSLVGYPNPSLLSTLGDVLAAGRPANGALFDHDLEPGRPVELRLNDRSDLNHAMRLLPQADIVICNYDLLGVTNRQHESYVDGRELWTPLLKRMPFKAVVADESHLIKGHTAIRTVASIEVARSVQARGGLAVASSGSPVLNQRVEMASQLDFIGRLHEFGGSRKAVKNMGDLAKKMRARCFIRRLKRDVINELPARQHTPLLVPTNELDAKMLADYRKAEADVLHYLAESAAAAAEAVGLDPRSAAFEARMRAQAAEHLVAITTLKRLAARAKLHRAKSWVEDFLRQTDGKIIVFAHHIDVLHELGRTFGVDPIDGDMPPKKRMEIVQRFQNDPEYRVAVMAIKAGGVGVTMTAAQDVLFVEFDWSPLIHDQAIDRCYGRMNDLHGATGWYVMAQGTIDQKIGVLLDQKRAECEHATDGDVGGADDPGSRNSIFTDLVVALTKEALG